MTLSVEGHAVDYPRGTLVPPHCHDAHQIVHAAAGIMRVSSGDETAAGTWIVPPGRALWMPERTAHWIHCSSAVAMRTVYLKGEHPGFPAGCAVWRISPLLREIVIRLAEGAAEDARPHLLALLVGEIETVRAIPLYVPRPASGPLGRLSEALEADPADPRTLAQWAGALGLSSRSLIRRFRAETGMTFREWRRQLRLLAALERLGAGRPVSQVAYEVGFESPSAFIAAFRETLGTTPGRYFEPELTPARAPPRRR